ncbi:MAG TPA: glycosyltransferase [Bacteroidales bacterium]|nr:glycosyltransferase [Bacteroidales bacterium]HRZ75989.1 glycosyltransferase [Bacteroidales bacterium]
MKKGGNTLWRSSASATVRGRDKFLLMALFVAGVISLGLLADWWFRPEHILNIWFFIIFSTVFWYGAVRLVLIWINYLLIRKPDPRPVPEGLSVAIFTTCTHGEPLGMFEKTLAACRRVSYPHTTYLLTDREEPEVALMAERHGAVLLDMRNTQGAKAGKINKALGMTNEEFILILDPDHIPFPEFLDHTLGYFGDPGIGFVQVSQAYYNQRQSFTARGAAEQTYTFYGPTQMGLFGTGSSVAIGANCTFRRAALEEIGGHAVGLAEDLLTSLRLHAAGWKSVYNPVVVSRGLVPEDFGSYCKQQLKWSRGVFEIAFTELPRLFRRLSGWQRLSYAAISTYYFVGATAFFFTLIPFLYAFTGVMPASMSFVDFVINGSFVALISLAIYLYVQRWMAHPDTETGFHWRGMILKYAAWPVYFLGFLLAVVNVDIPYIPTSKNAVTGKVTPFARPLQLHLILFLLTFAIIFIRRRFYIPQDVLVLTAERTWGMFGFAALAALMSLWGLYAAWETRRMKVTDPWEEIDTDTL